MSSVSIDNRRKTLTLMLLLSVLLHLGFFWLLNSHEWFLYNPHTNEKTVPEEVTFVFPENKQKDKVRKIVENQNANDLKPSQSDLLSEHDSQARNPEAASATGPLPSSRGNSELPNLAARRTNEANYMFPNKPFSKQALGGETMERPSLLAQKEAALLANTQSGEGSGENLEQKNFSVLEVGGLTLSTYKWDWAPYIIALKRKLVRVWVPPAAYYMGLVHGSTVIKFTITRQGKMTGMRVLKHRGHNSLEISSSKAIEALFPFLPLPDDFPDETLTIMAELIYPAP